MSAKKNFTDYPLQSHDKNLYGLQNIYITTIGKGKNQSKQSGDFLVIRDDTINYDAIIGNYFIKIFVITVNAKEIELSYE